MEETASLKGDRARQRLLAGMQAAILELGEQPATVADVVRHAGVSRRTFYQHFTDRTDCFLAVLNDYNQRIAGRIATSVDGDAAWQEQIGQAITAWIRATAEEPELAMAAIRELAAVPGHRAFRRAEDAAFIGLVRMLMPPEVLAREGLEAPHDATVIILLGGVRDLIAATLEDAQPLEALIAPATDAAIALFGPRVEVARSS